ncbi:hypothetical protein KI387_021068, partial [Taxus chinensis]
YNLDSVVWGNITWGHVVSRDLVHSFYLNLAMVTDQCYNINGVWMGSTTILQDGRLVMLYTGSTNESVQYDEEGIVHQVPRTGMRECVDFYPVNASETKVGLNTSATGADVDHVLKVNFDDDKHDYYTIGTYD